MRRHALVWPAAFVAGLAVFGLQSAVWPLMGGRDWQDYLIFWHELWRPEPLFPALMVVRMPLTPLALGPLADLGGMALAEVGAGILFAASVVAWALAARRHGPRSAIAMYVLLVAIPAYGWFFHQIGSDPVFSFVLALVAVQSLRAAARPTVAQFALAGALVAALVLTRPTGLPFLVLAVLPLGVAGSARRRLVWALAFMGAAAAPLAAWSIHNGVRFDDYTLARGGRAGIPLFRAFVVDGIVAADNGPASQKLAAAIERDLVREEPYRAWGFDATEVLEARNKWVMDDLVRLADRTWGWHDDYSTLFDVGVEAVRAHPSAYAGGVGLTFAGLVLASYRGPPGVGYLEPAPVGGPSDAAIGAPRSGRRLPGRVASQRFLYSIAFVNNWALSPSPRFRVVDGLEPLGGRVWSPQEKRELQWASESDARRYADLRATLLGYLDDLSRDPRSSAGDRALRALTVLLAPIGFWGLLAAAFWALRRPSGLWPSFLLAAASAAALLEISLGFALDSNYAMPFVPVFALAAFGAMAGPSGRMRTRPPSGKPPRLT